MKRTGFIFLTLLIVSCSAQSQELSSTYSVNEIQDIVYHSGTDATNKHKLDLYLPVERTDAPLLLWIHGGAWAFGSRKDDRNFARNLASSGIAVASVSYRLSPALWVNPPKRSGIEHPEHIRDIARAFNFKVT